MGSRVWSLGTATLVGSGTLPSDAAFSGGTANVYTIKVPQLTALGDTGLNVTISNTPTVSPTGVIIGWSGSSGTAPFDTTDNGTALMPDGNTLMQDLVAMGYIIYLPVWSANWAVSPTTGNVGWKRLNARNATVFQFIHDNLAPAGVPITLAGASYGSAIVYSLMSDYNMSGKVSNVVMQSGPFCRMHRATSSLAADITRSFSATNRQLLDRALGYNDSAGGGSNGPQWTGVGTGYTSEQFEWWTEGARFQSWQQTVPVSFTVGALDVCTTWFLTSQINSGATVTSLAVQGNAGSGGIPQNVSTNDVITIINGANSQSFTASAPAAAGSTSVSVNSATANATYPVNTQLWGTSVDSPIPANLEDWLFGQSAPASSWARQLANNRTGFSFEVVPNSNHPTEQTSQGALVDKAALGGQPHHQEVVNGNATAVTNPQTVNIALTQKVSVGGAIILSVLTTFSQTGTVTVPAGFTLVQSQVTAGTKNLSVYVKTATSADDAATYGVTFTGTGTVILTLATFACGQFIGPPVIEAVNTGTGTGTSFTATPASNPTTAKQVVYVTATVSGTTTISQPSSGWTAIYVTSNQQVGADFLTTSTGTNPGSAFTLGTSRSWAWIAFRIRSS